MAELRARRWAQRGPSALGGLGFPVLALAGVVCLGCGPRLNAAVAPAPIVVEEDIQENAEPSLKKSTALAVEPDAELLLGSPDADADGLDADIAALQLAASGDSQASALLDGDSDGDSDKDEATRERPPIVYRVTPQGLIIEVDGLHFRPSAKAVRNRNGSYGIELELRAESFDGRSYLVREPAEGPLSIAGSVETVQGRKTRFSDTRQGGKPRAIEDEEPVVFRQKWPGAGQPKLKRGQTVTLEVGLWGAGEQTARERPIRKLFVVKMLGAKRSAPVISPPSLDWGN